MEGNPKIFPEWHLLVFKCERFILYEYFGTFSTAILATADKETPYGAFCNNQSLFLSLSLYTARPSCEYYRQVYFVHSRL